MSVNEFGYLQKPRETKKYAQMVLDVFLPAGYPQSVSEDYIQCVMRKRRAWRAEANLTCELGIRSTYVNHIPLSPSPMYTKHATQDSLQAFSSSIAGMLSSRAVLQGTISISLQPNLPIQARYEVTDDPAPRSRMHARNTLHLPHLLNSLSLLLVPSGYTSSVHPSPRRDSIELARCSRYIPYLHIDSLTH
jgi:hypothetical protein